ncbi:YcfL family protein [Aeromonas bivalvium]|uniref:YcfL family protein n=1 Tax=Aeromonas bivalvium TaxID=440079 RepID=UPI0038D1F790
MKRLALACGLALLLPACASNTSGVALSAPSGGPAEFRVDNGSLDLQLAELGRRQQNGLLQVNVALTNQRRGDNHLQYLFYWYDASGQEVAPDGRGWTPLVMHGQQRRTLSALAPTREVLGYRLVVREVIAESN